MEALLEECRGVKTKWLYGVVKSITVGGCNTSYMYGDSWTVAEFAVWWLQLPGEPHWLSCISQDWFPSVHGPASQFLRSTKKLCQIPALSF